MTGKGLNGEFIDRAIGIESSLRGVQGSSVGEVIIGPGHLWRSHCWVGVTHGQGGLSRTTLEGSWRGLGSALPSAVGRGRPLRVAAPGLGSARGASAQATAERQGHLRLPGGAAGLQTGACLGVPGEGSFHLHPSPWSPCPDFSPGFTRSHLASGAKRVGSERLRDRRKSGSCLGKGRPQDPLGWLGNFVQG